MLNYIIIILLVAILHVLLVSIFVFLTYKPTREIVIKQVNLEIEEFHSEYLANDYHLKLVNMNTIHSIDKAIVYIKSFPEYFDTIPESEIFCALLYINFLNKYDYYRKKILYLIGLNIVVTLAIAVGLTI